MASEIGWIKLNVDGSCNRALASVACGGVLRDHQGRWLRGFSSFEGDGDAHMAELLVVVQGLRIAWQSWYRKIVCESDCLNVIDSLNKNKSVNLHSCAMLLIEVRFLFIEDWEVVFQHVLRENNAVAHLLA